MPTQISPQLYREVSITLGKLINKNGAHAITAINRYLKLRRQKAQTEMQIEILETQLEKLKKVQQISDKKRVS